MMIVHKSHQQPKIVLEIIFFEHLTKQTNPVSDNQKMTRVR